MVGRQAELGIIQDKLDLAANGLGQVIGIVADAGLGKSRLVAEVIRNARRKGFVGYGGACQSDGLHTPYLAWKSVWQAFFDVDPDMPLRKQIRNIEGEIEDRVPNRVEAMPLLNALLDLNIPENEFTQPLEPKIRQSALYALLEDCLKAAATDEPVLIVIEDLHSIDALSHDLLEQLARTLANYRVCFVLAYRPPQITRAVVSGLETLPQFIRLDLHELTREEAENAIRAKLAQLYPARSGALPDELVEVLMARAQGNPFFLEELLNYLRDRGLDPLDPTDLSHIELPDSLHTLILSRIDQLREHEKITLRAASIIGRLFRARWLTGYYPDLGEPSQVRTTLDTLDALDITPLDSAPESTYLFKHIVTHEVTYESQPFAARASLHEQLAKYLEGAYPEALPLEALAFHYGRSKNQNKQCAYLRKAGETAQKNYANAAALGFYGELLPLLKEDQEKIEIYLLRGGVLRLMGKFDEAETDFRTALALADQDTAQVANAQFALSSLSRLRGEYEQAQDWLAQVMKVRKALEDKEGLAQVLVEMGTVLWRKGEYAQARDTLNKGLRLSRDAGYTLRAAQALNILGLVAMGQGNYPEARTLYDESLNLWREVGDKAGISATLNNLGIMADSQGDYATASVLYQESALLDREIGDKAGISASLNNLGIVARVQGNYNAARIFYEESLTLRREMGDKFGITMSLNNLGVVALAQSDYVTAQALLGESLSLFREIEDKAGTAATLKDLASVALARIDKSTARALYEESLVLCKEIGEKQTMASSLLGLGLVGLVENNTDVHKLILHSLRLRQETGEQLFQTSSLIGVAGLALREGNAIRAAQWLGAVDAALKTLQATLEPDMIAFHTQTLVAVREQLGVVAFAAAWDKGSQWSLEEAVKKALHDNQE